MEKVYTFAWMRTPLHIKLKIHAPLLPIVVSVMIGIVVGEQLTVGWWMPALLVLMGVLTALLSRHPHWQSAFLYADFLMLGACYSAITRQAMDVKWPGAPIVVDAVVIEEPVIKDKTVVVDVRTTTDARKLRCRITRDARSEQITLGSGLHFTARVRNIHPWQSGHFDYQRYMRSHGFVGEAFVGARHWQYHQQSLSRWSSIDRIRLKALCWRHHLLQEYQRWDFHDDVYAIVAAMTLGDKSQMSPALKDLYAQVGVSHILAMSGMHLSIIYMVILLFLRWWRYQMATQVVTVLAIWAFAFLVGLSPSVVRAAFMISLYALLSLGYRQDSNVNVLAFAALCMLAFHPFALFDVGFQLSFTAVFAILLFHPLLTALIPESLQNRYHALTTLFGSLTVSLSAQLGTAPLIAYYFGRLPVYFLLSNILVMPLTTLVIYLAMAGLVTFWCSPLQHVILLALSATVVLMNQLLSLVASLPYNNIDGIEISMPQVGCLYVLLGCAYWLVRRRFMNSWRVFA